MLRDIVIAALDRLSDVVVHEGCLPDGIQADLVVERDEQLLADITPTVRISGAGQAVLSLPTDQLSENTLALVVNSARRHDPDWLDTVLTLCRRIDAVVERATEVAEAAYEHGGGFEDWRAAFAGGRLTSTSDPSDPFGSSMATGSVGLDQLLHSLALGSAPPGDEAAATHPFAELVEAYRLNGREVDTLLLCFAHELDPRYGRRFAYLLRDPSATAPTIDLVAALLAGTSAERLELQRELSTGPLVTHGLVRLTRARADSPDRSSSLTLDRSVLRILCGDTAPMSDQDLIDPALTGRSSRHYRPPASAEVAVDALAEGDVLHLAGADPTNRRAVAIDLAASTGRVLLATTFADLAADTDGERDAVRRRAEGFRRELIRLGALGYVDDVPRDDDRWQAALAPSGGCIVSGGPDPARALIDTGLPARRNVAIVPPRGTERRAMWKAATDRTGITLGKGLEALATRFGIPVDRAVAALEAAANERHRDHVSADEVIAVLTSSTVHSAGGLLTTVRPRARLDDLIVAEGTRRELAYACARVRHRDDVILDQGWDRRSGRLTGTYLLFAGPSGTGKTMAAEAIAHELGLPIQYLELSSLLSRWVGEFEKAVDTVFSAAEATGGIIAMNEADALLAPRTEVDNAQARYANAGTSHLLSRLEQFGGHVIFTSNLLGADSIDPAFHRRLTATIRFRLPNRTQRQALWRSVWPDVSSSGAPVRYAIEGEPVQRSERLRQLADEHELSGGSIANIARNAAFLATQRRAGSPPPSESGTRHLDIDVDDLDEAVRIELTKIGDFRVLLHSKAAS